MTNSEKYKDAESRIKAYRKEEQVANDCEMTIVGFASWLDAEAKEDILNCPFCNSECEARESYDNEMARHTGEFHIFCKMCDYRSEDFGNENDAITAHNKLVKDAIKGRKPFNLDKLLEVCHKLCPDNKGYEPKCESCENKKLLDKLRNINDEISEYKHKICGGW